MFVCFKYMYVYKEKYFDLKLLLAYDLIKIYQNSITIFGLFIIGRM